MTMSACTSERGMNVVFAERGGEGRFAKVRINCHN